MKTRLIEIVDVVFSDGLFYPHLTRKLQYRILGLFWFTRHRHTIPIEHREYLYSAIINENYNFEKRFPDHLKGTPDKIIRK